MVKLIECIVMVLERLADFIKSEPISISFDFIVGITTLQIGFVGFVCGVITIAYILIVSKQLRKELNKFYELKSNK